MPSTKELLVRENGKVGSKPRVLLYKENKECLEAGETSFRVYYGATGAAVPFVWESQPGTPKHPMFDKSNDENEHFVLPPLTPPPSYTSSSALGNTTFRKTRKQRFLGMIFSSMSRKNSHVTPTSSLLSSPWSTSTSTSSSSSSSLSSPRCRGRTHKSHRRSLSMGSSRVLSPLFGHHEDHENVETPSSGMCFGFKKKQGCYKLQDVKDAILSNRGH